VRRIEHHAALPYSDISAFMAQLRGDRSVAARALEFTILTAARAGEVIGARWEEINTAERLWIVPAERMKAGKEHRVPLSEAAVMVLEKLAENRSGAFVFSGAKAGRPVGDSTLFDLLKRLNGDVTTHGFRSSFRDWAAERTNFPSELAEMALAHTVGDKVEAAYRRGDMFEKRRQLADAWAAYCAGTEDGDNVVDLRRFATTAA
jgi:integrase